MLPFNIASLPITKVLSGIIAALLLVLVIGFLYFKGEAAVGKLEVERAQGQVDKIQSEKDALDLENEVLKATAETLSEEARLEKERAKTSRELYESAKAKNAKTSSELAKATSELEKLKNKPGTPEYDLLNQKIPDHLIDVLNGDSTDGL